MTATLRAACLQLTPGNDLARNLEQACAQIDAAVEDGAEFVALPEFGTFLDRSSAAMRASAAPQDRHEALSVLQRKAGERRVWLLVGSVLVPADRDGKLLNRSLMITPQGQVCGHYDKIHLFRAELPGGRQIDEARQYLAGQDAVLLRTPFGTLGMTICYDLRFPGLYRSLAQAGAEILLVPSAFTAETGRAHWEPLLRARAIENGCFVLAPATCGTHPGDWETFGHSMIVDPWGEILAECRDDAAGFAIATINLERVAEARRRISSLTTEPPYSIREISVGTERFEREAS